MKIIIGGYAQGKLNYALKGCEGAEYQVWDGRMPEDTQRKIVLINHFHNWVKSSILNGGNPEEEIRIFMEEHPDCVIISDEIGSGIVPMEAFEREWRERTGKILAELAQKAEEVVRVICGIGQRIK